MDSCMLPGERTPVKRSKSWRREHQETHSRHSRYIKVQSERETGFDNIHSPSPACMDSSLSATENVACNAATGNRDCISLYRNGENLESNNQVKSISNFIKKINETQYRIDNRGSSHFPVQGGKTDCVQFTILKRNTCEIDSFEISKMENSVPHIPAKCVNENCIISNVENQNDELSKQNALRSIQSSIPSNNQTNNICNEQQNMSLNNENLHPALTSESSSYHGLVVSEERCNNSEETSSAYHENEFTSGNINDVFLFVDLKCSFSEMGILDPQLETKVHTGSLGVNDKHNSNYRISNNCENSNNCNCITQYVLSNGLIGFFITTDFHFQVMTILYSNFSVHNLKLNINEIDSEEILINFGQVKQKLAIKSKLRSINNTGTLQRPDERHFSALDSSLKRNTAFVRKLRSFTGSQLTKLLEDMSGLNLTKYLSEIAAAIVECKLKMSDVWAAVQLCCAFHQLYSDFSSHLIENWHKVLSIKKDDPIPNTAKLRVDLRFYAELITVGIFTPQEGLPLLGNALTMLTYWDKDHYNIKIILSFCRHCGLEYAGLVSQKVRLLSEKYNIPAPTSDFLSRTKMHSVKSLIKDYYESLNKHLIKEYLTLRDFIKQNTRILQTKGELSVKRKEKLEILQTSLKRLLDGAIQLADILDEDPPQLPPDTMSENEGISLNERNDFEINEGETFWEDEDTRLFYECLPSMNDFIPVKNISSEIEEDQESNCQPEDNFEDNIDEDGDSEIENNDNNIDIEMEEEEEEVEEEEIEAVTNTSNKVLMETFLKTLPTCISKDLIDKSAIEFVKKLNTKPNRKKLIKLLFTVPRTRPDLLPFYARFVAAVQPVIPDIASELGKMLKQEFRYHIRKKDQLNIESKIKVVRFIAELVKFNMYGRNEVLQCLKLLVQDFSHHHIDMCCSLVEGCGKFLSRYDDSRFRLHHYLDQIMRKKTVTPLNARYVTMIENAYYQVNSPEIEKKIYEDRPPEHEFIRNLVYHEMSRSNVDDILNLILKINWDDPLTASYAVKCLTRAYKVKYFNISCLASLTSGIALQQEMEGIQVVDGVLEDIQLGMELNLQEHCQRRVAMIKYLGELYNYRMVENTNIFKALYSLITFGVTWNNELYSPIDPPESLFRIRLVCTLLNTCGEYFSTGSSKRKLDEYLSFFQYYFWFKFSQPCWKSDYPFPYDVQFMYEDIVKRLRPKVQLFSSLQDAQNATKKICMEYEKLNFPTSDSETSNVSHIEDLDKKVASEMNEDVKNNKTYSEAFSETFPSDNLRPVSPTSKEPLDILRTGTSDTLKEPVISPNSNSEDQPCDYWTMLRPRSPEDQEFLSAYDRMISENIQNRLHEPVKPQHLDISVPLYIGSISKKAHEKFKKEDNSDAVVNFVLILRKGHKALYKNIAVPVNSEMAAIRRYNEEAERAEKEYVKRLTLDINERLEEEDYQEMLTKVQKSTPGNQNRDRRHRSHNSKEVPNVDTIFSSNKKLR